MKVVGAVTIGQSPRTDVVPEMSSLAPRTRWIEAGALDNLNEATIRRLAPSNSEFPLVTRLKCGQSVTIGFESIKPFIQSAITRVETEADLIVLLCSGPFSLRAHIPLLLTHHLVFSAVRALQLSRLAILKPHKKQVDQYFESTKFKQRYSDIGVETIPIFVPAYGSANFEEAGHAARSTGASAIVMDCFGYTLDMKRKITKASGLPTFLVRSLAAKMVTELTD